MTPRFLTMSGVAIHPDGQERQVCGEGGERITSFHLDVCLLLLYAEGPTH